MLGLLRLWCFYIMNKIEQAMASSSTAVEAPTFPGHSLPAAGCQRQMLRQFLSHPPSRRSAGMEAWHQLHGECGQTVVGNVQYIISRTLRHARRLPWQPPN